MPAICQCVLIAAGNENAYLHETNRASCSSNGVDEINQAAHEISHARGVVPANSSAEATNQLIEPIITAACALPRPEDLIDDEICRRQAQTDHRRAEGSKNLIENSSAVI